MFVSMLRKMALLTLTAVLILAASSCRPDRPWAYARIGPVNIETYALNTDFYKVIIKGDKRCCASKNFESSSAKKKY